eukprot:tig00020951_g16454.t1
MAPDDDADSNDDPNAAADPRTGRGPETGPGSKRQRPQSAEPATPSRRHTEKSMRGYRPGDTPNRNGNPRMNPDQSDAARPGARSGSQPARRGQGAGEAGAVGPVARNDLRQYFASAAGPSQPHSNDHRPGPAQLMTPQWRWSPVPANSRAPRRTPPGPGGARHPRHPSAIATAASSTAISTRTVNMRTLSRETTIRRPAAGAAAGAKTVAIAKRGANEAAGKLRVTETKAKAQLATADWPAEGKERTLEATATTRATGDTGTGAPGTATMPTTSTSTLMTPTTRTREMTTETMTLTVELERGGYTATMNTAAWASMARAKITTQGTPRVTPTWGCTRTRMEMASMAEHRAPMTMLGGVHVGGARERAGQHGGRNGHGGRDGHGGQARGAGDRHDERIARNGGQRDGNDGPGGPGGRDGGNWAGGAGRRLNWDGEDGGDNDGQAPAGGDGNVYGGGGGGGRPAAAANGTGPNTAKVYLVLFGDGLASRLVPPDAPQDTRDEILASARSTCRREGLQIRAVVNEIRGRIAAAHQADRARIRDHRIGEGADPSALRNPLPPLPESSTADDAVTLRCGHVVCGDRIEESSPCIAIKYANITEARRAAQLLTPVTPQLATLAVLGATGPLSVGIHVDAPASSTEFFAIEAELGCRKMERGTLSSFMKNTVLRALTSGINPDAYEANDVVVAYNELAVKCPNGPTARYLIPASHAQAAQNFLANVGYLLAADNNSALITLPRFQDPDPDFCWNNDRKHVLNGVLIFAGAHAGCGHADANQEHVPFPGDECQLDITQLVPDRQFIMDLRAAGVLYMTTRPYPTSIEVGVQASMVDAERYSTGGGRQLRVLDLDDEQWAARRERMGFTAHPTLSGALDLHDARGRQVIILEVTTMCTWSSPSPSPKPSCARHTSSPASTTSTSPCSTTVASSGGDTTASPSTGGTGTSRQLQEGKHLGVGRRGAVDCMWTLPTAERVAGAPAGLRAAVADLEGPEATGAVQAALEAAAGLAEPMEPAAEPASGMPAAGRAQPMAAVAVGWTSSGATSPGAALLGEPGAGWAPPAVGADSQAVAPAAGVDEEHVQRLPWQY